MDNMNARLSYENAKILLLKNGKDPEKAALTQSYIRSEILATTTTSQYLFQTQVNQFNNGSSGLFSTEKRLAQQDWFIATSIFVGLAAPSSATDGAFRPLSFPDPSIFSTSGAAAANYVLYNGFLSLLIDNQLIVPEIDTMRFLRIPNQQAVANAYYTTSGINLLSEMDGSEQGFYPIEPSLVFNGAANMQLLLNLPAAIATLQSANQRLVVIMRGIKAQNVTSVK